MATVNEKMTTIADGVRLLSGSSTALSLDDIAGGIQTANAEVSTQATKLDELKTILASKAAGGGSGGTVETCAVTLNWSAAEGSSNSLYPTQGSPSVAYINANGELSTLGAQMKFPISPSWTCTVECRCGSLFVFSQGKTYSYELVSYSTSAEITESTLLPLAQTVRSDFICALPATAGEYVINVYYE